tara:strand:+ start:114 stop:341 length:228 start_codon:yes stop_codon:yes gene_type:complete
MLPTPGEKQNLILFKSFGTIYPPSFLPPILMCSISILFGLIIFKVSLTLKSATFLDVKIFCFRRNLQIFFFNCFS